MARIPKEEVERLRREVSVERLVEAYGVKVRRDHDKLVGVCPLHDEGEHGLVITPKTNTWMCSECGGGSCIEWTMKVHGVSFRHAAEMLRKDYPSVIAATEIATTTPPKESTKTKLPRVVTRDATDEEVLVRVVDYYHSILKESPEALGYLASRGLNDAEMIERFKVGFANRTLAYRIPEKHRREGEQIRGRLQKLGILRASGHENLNGSIVIPILDADGVRVRGVYGRKITARLRDGTPLHLYVPDPPRGIWNELGLVGGEVVLAKSLIDALTFWCAGVRNVTAAYGVDGITDDHREAFKRYAVKKVYIAVDRSRAADRGAEKLSIELNDIGIETFRIMFPKNLDANDYAREGKSLEVLLRQAEWTGKGNLSVTVPEDLGTVEPVVTEPTIPTTSTCASSPMIATGSADEMVFGFGDRRWRVRGLPKNTSHGDLKVNILVSREGAGFHIDTLDLYSAKQRTTFIKAAAIEIRVTDDKVKKELGQVLLELEARVDEQIRQTLKPTETKPSITEAEQEEALGLLRDPKLVERIVSDLGTCGLVGEETNKLLGYVAAVSRKLDQPLAVVVQSSSAAGKSALMEAILDMVPDEERVSFSAMTGQVLYYMGETDLQHKVLSVAEGEGAARASYPLKILQSEGSLVIASTGKDPITGKLVAHEYRVTGPVMTFLTTTAIDLDEELLNRCLVLTVDEGREQTRRVHARQRTSQTLPGLLARRDRDRIVRVHRNAQRLLRPLLVVNPFAESLSFADTRTRARRDHAKFLGLVAAVALLFQHQREVKVVEHGNEKIEYIEVLASDIELATRLLRDVLDSDELPPVTRSVLTMVETFVTEKAKAANVPPSEVRFTKRELRDRTGIGHTQTKIHLRRLEEMEYVRAHRERKTFLFSLAYDTDRAGPNAIGRGPVGHRAGVDPGLSGVRDGTGTSSLSPSVGPDRDHVNGVPEENASYPR